MKKKEGYISRLLCWFGFHWPVYQDNRTGVYLQIEPYYFSGRVKCFLCGRKIQCKRKEII
jgi:hypothetical protein